MVRSEEHTSELQSRELISYAVFCLKKKKQLVQVNRKIGGPGVECRRHDIGALSLWRQLGDIARFFFQLSAAHRDLHKLTHSFPTRRSSDLSLRDHTPLERFAGFEYRACCWRVRLGARDRKSTRLNSSHVSLSRMPSSA